MKTLRPDVPQPFNESQQKDKGLVDFLRSEILLWNSVGNTRFTERCTEVGIEWACGEHPFAVIVKNKI
ncbi:MAG: hypothetical protein ACTSVM_00465, partial [Candidatus Ranarchaeia archaeon]